MNNYPFLTSPQRLTLAVAAVAAALVVVGAALAPFAVGGRTPYFGNDAASLAAVERCRGLPPRAERHACLREVAAARADSTASVLAQVSR